MSAPTTRFTPGPSDGIGFQQQPGMMVYGTPAAVPRRLPLYSLVWILCTLVAGVIAGRFLYVLWERVAFHEEELAKQQAAIRGLTETTTAVSQQANHLNALDAGVEALNAQLKSQEKKMALLERGENGLRTQLNGMNMRWQRQASEPVKPKAPTPAAGPAVTAVAPPKAQPVPPPAPNAQAGAFQVNFDKHNETFSPDLKPTPDSIAQIAPNGLVVWMTPRPGFSRAVPTSVIGRVRGLGTLVHNWEDSNHYYITDAGSWMPEGQR